MKKIETIFGIAFSIVFGILFFVPILVMFLIGSIGESIWFSKQLKRLKNVGYKISKVKANRQKVYLFTFKSLVIRFLPNKIHDISFDGGETFVPIVESNIGTLQEKENLKNLQYQYNTCDDYRDRDMYDSTKAFIDFIIKNVSLKS